MKRTNNKAQRTAAVAGPKYRQLLAILTKQIRSGALPTGGPFPTEQALAAQYGLSRYTIRMALAELQRDGYLVRRQRTGTVVRFPPLQDVEPHRMAAAADIGVLIPRVTVALYSGIIQGVEGVCSDAGHHVIIGNYLENPQRENRYITEMIQRPVAGLVICPSYYSLPSHYYRLVDRKILFTFVDTAVDGIDTDMVFTNNFQGARDGAKLLVAAGCRHVAFLSGYQSASTSRERLAGCRSGLEDAGCSLDAKLVFSGEFTPEFGEEAVTRLLRSGAKVDGLFIANDPITVGAVRALRAAGRHIPEDMRICTFDDPYLPMEDRVPMILIKQPSMAVGKAAAQLLLDRIAERRSNSPRAPTRIIRLDAEIVVPQG